MADLVEDGTELIEPYTNDNLVLNLSVSDSFIEAVEEAFATSSTPDTAKEKQKQSNPKKKETGHRILTIDEIIGMKKAKAEEKEQKEKAKEERKRKREEKQSQKSKQEGKKSKKATTISTCDTNTCSLCLAPYQGIEDSLMWVECSTCKDWMHVQCIPVGIDITGVFDENAPFHCHKHL